MFPSSSNLLFIPSGYVSKQHSSAVIPSVYVSKQQQSAVIPSGHASKQHSSAVIVSRHVVLLMLAVALVIHVMAGDSNRVPSDKNNIFCRDVA
jgi:hypothetical protein